MRKLPVGRKTANSNRPNLGDEERENAKYDALLKERGLFDDDMTLQEKRDYYEALVASMSSVSNSKADSAHQGRLQIEEVDPIDHSSSNPSNLCSTVGDVANGSDYSQKCATVVRTPPKSIRDVEVVAIVSDPQYERGTNVCTVKATPVRRSSSPPPLEDTPDPNRRRRRMSDLERNDELETESHPLLKSSKLLVEMEDSDQDVIETVPNAETTYSLPKEDHMPISDAPVATVLEVKNHLQKFCQKLRSMNLTGNEDSLVFFSPEELKNYKVKDLPKFCRPETLEDPIVQQEILKLNTIVNAKRVPPDPETLTLDGQVDLIINQPKYVTHVLASKKRNKLSSSRKTSLEDDQFKDGDPQELDVEKFGQANSCGFYVAASSDEELIVSYKPGRVKAEAKSEARSNTRASTLAKPSYVDSDEDFEPDELIQRKTASKHISAGSKGRGSKLTRGTTRNTKRGNRGRGRVGRGRGRDDSEEEINVVDVLSLGTNKRTAVSPPSSGTHTRSFVPLDITREFIDKKKKTVPKVYGAIRRLNEPKHTGSSPSTSSSVRCGGVNVAEFLQSPNLPEVIRKRTMDSLIGCAYCPKTFIASDFLEKDEHEKLCRVSQSTRTTAAELCTDIATSSDESDNILMAVPPSKSSSRKANRSNGDGALITDKHVTELGVETMSPTPPKRSRKHNN